jgi:chromosome segregation ATPase
MTTSGTFAGILTITLLWSGLAGAADSKPIRPSVTMTEEERQALKDAYRKEIAERRRQQLEAQQAREAELKRIFEETTPAEEKAFLAMGLEKVRAEHALAKTWLDRYPIEGRKLALAVDDAKRFATTEDPEIAPIQRRIDALQSQLYELQAQRNALVEKHPRVREAVRAVTALQARQRELALWAQKLGLRVMVLEHDASQTTETPDEPAAPDATKTGGRDE